MSTVKSLQGENSDDPRAAALFKAMNIKLSLDAIRTVSSSSRSALCEGRLTIRMTMPQPGVPIGVPENETDADRATREQVQKQLTTTKASEITYKVEKTDDGSTYVTIVPTDGDADSQPNLQQQDQERQRQLQQNQADSVEHERAYQQQLEDQRNREWQERQQQLEQQEMQRR